MQLLDKVHLYNLAVIAGIQSVEVHTGSSGLAEIVLAVPYHPIEGSSLACINQSADLLAGHIVDSKLNMAGLGYRVRDRRGRVERVREVLRQSIYGRQSLQRNGRGAGNSAYHVVDGNFRIGHSQMAVDREMAEGIHVRLTGGKHKQ